MGRAAFYIRVSDEKQVDRFSLDAQKADIERWCTWHGHVQSTIYREDGVSAKSDRIDRRPQLVHLLEDAKKGCFDLVVVHTLDRWARNVVVQRQTLQLLGEAGVGFASVTEDIDFTTPSGKLMLTMIGGVAEFFSDQLAVHVKKGLHERARQGLANGGVPFGYLSCWDSVKHKVESGKTQRERILKGGCPEGGHPGGVHVVMVEGEALRQLFERYAAGGWTLTQAASWLNQQGFLTRNHRDTGRGAGPQPFTSWSVRDILRNPFYAGIVRWNGIEEFPGLHQTIVSQDLFDRAQTARLVHATQPRTFAANFRPYLMKGLLRCALCGERYWSERSGRQGRPYYRGARRGQECGCRDKSFHQKDIDARVGLFVYSLTLPGEWLESAKEAVRSSGPRVRNRREILEERKRRTGRAYKDLALSTAEYEREMSEIAVELSSLGDTDPIRKADEAAELLGNLEVLWREATVSERSRLLNALFDAIYIDAAGRIVEVAPRSEMCPLFASLSTKPETGVVISAEAPGIGGHGFPPVSTNTDQRAEVGGIGVDQLSPVSTNSKHRAVRARLGKPRQLRNGSFFAHCRRARNADVGTMAPTSLSSIST